MLTTVAGLLLYVLISRLALSWIASSYGLILTLGALAGLAAWLVWENDKSRSQEPG